MLDSSTGSNTEIDINSSLDDTCDSNEPFHEERDFTIHPRNLAPFLLSPIKPQQKSRFVLSRQLAKQASLEDVGYTGVMTRSQSKSPFPVPPCRSVTPNPRRTRRRSPSEKYGRRRSISPTLSPTFSLCSDFGLSDLDRIPLDSPEDAFISQRSSSTSSPPHKHLQRSPRSSPILTVPPPTLFSPTSSQGFGAASSNTSSSSSSDSPSPRHSYPLRHHVRASPHPISKRAPKMSISQ